MKKSEKMVKIVAHLPNLFLLNHKIGTDTPVGIRLVCVYLEHKFGLHRDTSHHTTSKISMTFHVSVWALCDYAPGDDKLGPWIKVTPGKTIAHEKGNSV